MASLLMAVGVTSANGCGWVAAYNALQLLGDYAHPADIIHYLETNGHLRGGGKLGFWADGIAEYLRSEGYDVTYEPFPGGSLDKAIQGCDAFVLQYEWYNSSTKKMGWHYVTIKYDPSRADGPYIIYNESDGNTSDSAYASIDAWYANTTNGTKTIISTLAIN